MLVIYDNTGYIFLIGTGFPEPQGLQHMYIEIPEGKYLKKINTSVTPHKPIFEDIPKSDVELLTERVSNLEANNEAILEGVRSVTGVE